MNTPIVIYMGGTTMLPSSTKACRLLFFIHGFNKNELNESKYKFVGANESGTN